MNLYTIGGGFVAIPLGQGQVFNVPKPAFIEWLNESQSLWVRDRFLIVRGVFSPCFQCFAGVFSNFCFCEKVGASVVVFIRVFHGCLGCLCFADGARILLYLVGFFYTGTVFLRVVLEKGYRQ